MWIHDHRLSRRRMREYRTSIYVWSTLLIKVDSDITQSANTSQHGLLIVGRILLGFGSIVLEISQNKLYAHWFAGSTLSFVVAIDLAWNSLTSIIARLSAVPMSRLGGWYGWALWIPSFVIMFCTLIVLAYIWFESQVPEVYRPVRGSRTRDQGLNGFGRFKFAMLSITQLSVASRRLRKCSTDVDDADLFRPMFFWILCGTGKLTLVSNSPHETPHLTPPCRNIPERSSNSLQRQPGRYPRKDKGNIDVSCWIQFVSPKCRYGLYGSCTWVVL
jgi:hypothetical protein